MSCEPLRPWAQLSSDNRLVGTGASHDVANTVRQAQWTPRTGRRITFPSCYACRLGQPSDLCHLAIGAVPRRPARSSDRKFFVFASTPNPFRDSKRSMVTANRGPACGQGGSNCRQTMERSQRAPDSRPATRRAQFRGPWGPFDPKNAGGVSGIFFRWQRPIVLSCRVDQSKCCISHSDTFPSLKIVIANHPEIRIIPASTP